jgi:hypothetical protein
VAEKPDLIIHLAAIVSGEAEADFEKGYAVNLDGTRTSSRRCAVELQSPPDHGVVIAVFGRRSRSSSPTSST